MINKSLNHTFKTSISRKYGQKFLRIYKNVIKNDKEYKYICSIKFDGLLIPTVHKVEQFLFDNGIEYIGLYNSKWFALKNKEDLQNVKVLFSLMLNIGIEKILRVSLLEKYRISCKKLQDNEYRIYIKAYKDRNKANYMRRTMNGMRK